MCLVGVVVRRYIDFLILLIPTPTPLVSVLFCSSIPTFVRSCSNILIIYSNIDPSYLCNVYIIVVSIGKHSLGSIYFNVLLKNCEVYIFAILCF